MKIILKLVLVACFILVNAQLTSAASWKADNFDVKSLHTVVIDNPLYEEQDGVTKDAFSKMVKAQASDFKLIAYTRAEIEQRILADSGINLTEMTKTDRRNADKIFREQVGKYADAYIVPTIVRNTHFLMYYDVYSAKTQQQIYGYDYKFSDDEPGTLDSYQFFTRKFYKDLMKEEKAKK